MFIKLLKDKAINREDFYTYWLLTQFPCTEADLCSLMAVSVRTVQRSLSRLRRAGLAKKQDRISGVWCALNIDGVMTNLAQHNKHNTTLQNKQSEQSTEDTPVDNHSLLPTGLSSTVTTSTPSTTLTELTSLACRELNLPYSRRIEQQLAKMPGVTCDIICEAAAITLNEIVSRKSGYKPIRNPIGYFLMTVRYKCDQQREAVAVKRFAYQKLGQPSTDSPGETYEDTGSGDDTSNIDAVVQQIRAIVSGYATYFVPQWNVWMREVVAQLLPDVGPDRLLSLVREQFKKRPEQGVLLATRPRALGQWANKCAVAKGVDTNLDMYADDVLRLARERCADLELAYKQETLLRFAMAIGDDLRKGIRNYTAVYFAIKEADKAQLNTWLHGSYVGLGVDRAA